MGLIHVVLLAHLAGALVAPRRERARGALRRRAAPGVYEAAAEAARAAGALIVAAESDGRAVDSTKSNAKDLLTVTDVACQARIAGILAARVPGSRLLGEEDVAPGAAASAAAAAAAFEGPRGLVWVVDPIDGTANFVDGLPLSTVSVAAVEADGSGRAAVVAGVVYDPHRDELFGAIRGGGAWVERGGVRAPLAVSGAALADAIVYAGAPPTPRALGPSLRGIAAVAPECRTLRLLGSAALMLAYVAAGRGAAYFECDLSAWDTAAGALLVEEAGGTVEDADGKPYTPATRQIVAANGACRAELAALLADCGAARLDPE